MHPNLLCSYDFVHLLGLVDVAEYYRTINSDGQSHSDDSIGEAETYLAGARAFFESFADDAANLWDLIAGPYQNTQDLDDFIAGEGEESVDEEVGDNGPSSAQAAFREQEMKDEQVSLEKFKFSSSDSSNALTLCLFIFSP